MTLFEDVNKAMTGRVALLSEAEADLFCRVVSIPGDYVDLGTLWGGTAILAALAKRKARVDGQVYTIDFMKGGYWETGDPSVGLQKPTEATIHQNIAKFGLLSNVTVVKANSYPWPLPDDVQPTSVLVDCDHSYEGAKRDWEKVKSLKPQLVAFHDYNANTHPGVAKLVDEIMNGDDLYKVDEQAGTLIVFSMVEEKAEPVYEPEPELPDFELMTVEELKDELRERDLPLSGNKAELIKRLKKNA